MKKLNIFFCLLLVHISPASAADRGFVSIIDEGLSIGQDWLKDGRNLMSLIKNADNLSQLSYSNEKLSLAPHIMKKETTILANEYRLLAWNKAKAKKHIDAVPLYRKSLELNAVDARAWHGYGWSMGELGLYKKAENAFLIALSFDKNKDETWRHLGWNFQRQGDLTRAKQSYLEALFLNSKNTAATHGLNSLKPKAPITSAQTKGRNYFTIQAGVFSNRSNALTLAAQLGKNSLQSRVEEIKGKYHVLIGKYTTRQDAKNAISKIKYQGASKFVIRG